MLGYAIVLMRTDICGANPSFLGGSKGVPGVIVPYHMSLLSLPMIPLSPNPSSYYMDS